MDGWIKDINYYYYYVIDEVFSYKCGYSSKIKGKMEKNTIEMTKISRFRF